MTQDEETIDLEDQLQKSLTSFDRERKQSDATHVISVGISKGNPDVAMFDEAHIMTSRNICYIDNGDVHSEQEKEFLTLFSQVEKQSRTFDEEMYADKDKAVQQETIKIQAETIRELQGKLAELTNKFAEREDRVISAMENSNREIKMLRIEVEKLRKAKTWEYKVPASLLIDLESMDDEEE